MVNKFLEKRVEIEFEGNNQRQGNSLELEYYLLESEYADKVENVPQKIYGIEIVKKHQGILNERKKFENIFNTREKTKNLVELLADNTVTPSTLTYVLDDLLGM